jgi:hypothetical protein
MKKIISILLIFLFIFVSCTEVNNINDNETNDKPTQRFEYIIYSDSGEGLSENIGLNTENIEENVNFGYLYDLDFDFIDKTEVTNDKAPAKVEINTGKNTFSMILKRSYLTSLSESKNEKLAYLGKIDDYRTEDGRVEAHFRQDTKELTFFLNYDRERPVGTLSNEEAKEIADNLFISM